MAFMVVGGGFPFYWNLKLIKVQDQENRTLDYYFLLKNQCNKDLKSSSFGNSSCCYIYIVFKSLNYIQAAAHNTESSDLQEQALQLGEEAAVQYRELLQLVAHILNKPTGEAKANLPNISRKIAQCVTQLAQTAELLKVIYHFQYKSNFNLIYMIKA